MRQHDLILQVYMTSIYIVKPLVFNGTQFTIFPHKQRIYFSLTALMLRVETPSKQNKLSFVIALPTRPSQRYHSRLHC